MYRRPPNVLTQSMRLPLIDVCFNVSYEAELFQKWKIRICRQVIYDACDLIGYLVIIGKRFYPSLPANFVKNIFQPVFIRQRLQKLGADKTSLGVPAIHLKLKISKNSGSV